MVTFLEVFEFITSHPEIGWIVLFIWLLFELRSKRGRIYELDQKITGSVIVIRALAREESAIDEDKVDNYLADNGMEPEDFIEGDESYSQPFEDKESSQESTKKPVAETSNNDERSAQ